tara:strand:+ start:308 stop:601 length:294 start_codon:yes stop_codon:yes gene_type:complete
LEVVIMLLAHFLAQTLPAPLLGLVGDLLVATEMVRVLGVAEQTVKEMLHKTLRVERAMPDLLMGAPKILRDGQLVEAGVAPEERLTGSIRVIMIGQN